MPPISVETLPEIVLTFFLVFGRIGTALMAMPGFGDHFVNLRIRLTFALTFTVVLYPVVVEHLGPVPSHIFAFFVLLFHEIVIGLFLGTLAKIIHLSLSTAGIIISFNSALSNSLMFNPVQGQQSGLIGAFLTIMGLTFIFVANIHHIALSALVESYVFFDFFNIQTIGDMTNLIVDVFRKSFELSFKMASPFVFMSLIIYTGMGVMARLMPQMQVFFVIIPLQILLAFLILAVSLPMIMNLFMQMFHDYYLGLF